ncbi:MAG TPA: hypothetical protein VGD57_03435 [Candidatus Dormibacteraeota bacterium]
MADRVEVPPDDRSSHGVPERDPICYWLGCDRPATHEVDWLINSARVFGRYCGEHAGMIAAAGQGPEIRITTTRS